MSSIKKSVHLCSVCHYRHGRSVSVDGLLVEKEKILLIRRKKQPFKGFWALPGGYIEFGETAEEACRREFAEETGIDVKIRSLLGLFSHPARHPLQNIAAAFIVDRYNGEEKASDDAISIGWFHLGKLPKRLAFDHLEMIKSYVL